jgi:hypothetical protein
LSNTFAGSAYHALRGGALEGFVTKAGSVSVAFSPPLCGSRQVRTSPPRNSNSAASFAEARAARISAS